MRAIVKGLCVALAAGLALPAMAQSHRVWMVWAPKPDRLPPYTGTNRPIWRLADVLAMHKGQKSWSQDIIDTPRYRVRYIQMAPGEKTPVQFYGDDRVVWIVWSGRIRFDIEGQKPLVAGKGFMVQVPARVRYSLQTVGNTPSLRLEVMHAGRLPLYPADNGAPQPPGRDGMHYVKASTPTAPETFAAAAPNNLYIDFFKDIVAAHPNEGPKQPFFVADADNMVRIIRGPGVPTPPAGNRGHFHVYNDEFWFIMEGRIDYLIEGEKLFTADAGDVVYVPPGRWHRASYHAGGMDTRIAFNERPDLLHNYGAEANGRQ